MVSDLMDKVVLITGSSGGIGSALVKEFSDAGAIVYGTDLKGKKTRGFIPGDITDSGFRDSLLAEILNREERIDILVNNAGIYLRTPIFNIGLKEWDRLMEINLSSVFFLSQAVLETMIRRKSGAIVNIASVAGKVGGIIAGAHYSASKAGVECLTKSMAKYAAPFGVRVNAVAPGIIDTTMQDGVPHHQMKFLIDNIPMGRMGTPGEVARMILVLSSDLSSYVTGQNINVNGGNYM